MNYGSRYRSACIWLLHMTWGCILRTYVPFILVLINDFRRFSTIFCTWINCTWHSVWNDFVVTHTFFKWFLIRWSVADARNMNNTNIRMVWLASMFAFYFSHIAFHFSAKLYLYNSHHRRLPSKFVWIFRGG